MTTDYTFKVLIVTNSFRINGHYSILPNYMQENKLTC